MRKKILIDTDISLGTPRSEIDDGAALSYLINDPFVEIVGISSVHGNVDVSLATQNIHRIMQWYKLEDIPVVAGAEKPIVIDLAWEDWLQKWQSQYGETPKVNIGKGNWSLEEYYSKIINQFPGEITIVCLGPLTNIANLVTNHPEVVSKVKSIYVMGGDQNADNAEFNIRCDPDAAKIVFSKSWKIYAYGLHITRQLFLSRGEFANLPTNQKIVALLKKQSSEWINIVEENGWENDGCSLHDAVPGIAFSTPEICNYIPATIVVDCTFSPNRGKTIIHESEDNNTNILIASDINVPKAKELLLESFRK